MTPHPSRRRRVTAVMVALLALVMAITSCSSTGGKPRTSDSGMAAGTADTPRVTIAMITHGVPGNAFWDLVRKGAETAAAKDNIELRYSADPEAPNQANLVQSALDSKVAGIAVTLAKPDAMAPAVKAALAADIPSWAQRGLRPWQSMGIQQYFGQDETISGRSRRKRLTAEAPRRRCASSTSRATSPWRRAAPGLRRDSAAPPRCSTSTATTWRPSTPPSPPSCSRTPRSITSSPWTPPSP